MSTISSNLLRVLTCTDCGKDAARTSSGVQCSHCGLQYQYTGSGSLDMRLQKPKRYVLEFELGVPLSSVNGFQVEPLRANIAPEVDYSDVDVPWHLTKEILSYFPRAKSPDSLMLDLGCGGAIHKDVCNRAGFEWVGLDCESRETAILGDAHSLPFKSGAFEFVLSIAVLEHIRFPFVMMREACRVLKPHGRLIGTVAFLEPFHAGSFYHHTHLGVINVLEHGGFRIEKVAPSEEWSVLVAQASMGLFPKMPSFFSRSIVYPVQVLHKLWWQAGNLVTPNASKHIRVRNTTGAFTFIATKDDA